MTYLLFRRTMLGLLASLPLCSPLAAQSTRNAATRAKQGRSMKNSDVIQSMIYRLLVIEDHRESSDPLLKDALSSQHPEIVNRSLLALGRIGDPSTLPLILTKIKDDHPQTRMHAAFALGLLKQPESQGILEQRLLIEDHEKVRDQLYQALGRLQKPETLNIFRSALDREKSPIAQSGLALGLCFLFLSTESPSWDVPTDILDRLIQMLKAPAPLSISSAWALARYKGDLSHLKEASLIEAIQLSQEPKAKAIALKALGRFKTQESQKTLMNLLKAKESIVKVEAAAALVGQTPSPELFASLLQLAQTDVNMVRASALTSLASYRNLDPSTLTTLQSLYQNTETPWLKSRAFLAIASSLQNQDLNSFVLGALQNPDPSFKREVFTQLPRLGDQGYTWLQTFLKDPSPLVAGGALSVLHDLEKDQMSESIKSSMLEQLNRHDFVMSSLIMDAAAKFYWIDSLPQLSKAADETWSLGEYAVQENFMTALAAFAVPSTLPLVERGLQHPIRNVAIKAAEAYSKLTGKKSELSIPLNNKVNEASPSQQDITLALRSKLALETSKGRILMDLLPEAPLTATKIMQWSAKGFYNGLTFHRVVPGWVVQGGDPRGDGEGGDGLIRDEVSMYPHDPYTVGIATGGKDTGSTQMFFNLNANTRLNGSYTVFARVTEGFEVIEQLELGDRILKAEVLSPVAKKPSPQGKSGLNKN